MKLHLEFLDHRLDALDPSGGVFGRTLFRIVFNMAGQRDDSVLGGNAYVGGSDARLPGELGKHSFLKQTILRHKNS